MIVIMVVIFVTLSPKHLPSIALMWMILLSAAYLCITQLTGFYSPHDTLRIESFF